MLSKVSFKSLNFILFLTTHRGRARTTQLDYTDPVTAPPLIAHFNADRTNKLVGFTRTDR